MRHLHFGVSGRQVIVRNLFFVIARPVKGMSQSIGIFGSAPRQLLRFLTFQSFFENLRHSRASCVTNIFILIREVVEKQAEQTTAALYCMFSF